MLARSALTRQHLSVARRLTLLAAPTRLHHSSVAATQYGGPVGNSSHRVYFSRDNVPHSPWHDIPLLANASACEYNMICEIPRWSNAKLEIDTSTPFNPIKQDSKNGRPRYVADIFPYKGYIWNYGAFPQTFEDPSHTDKDTGCVGDSDPVDVIEVGQAVCAEGSIHRVKVLGLVALIDGGETDWKVLAIRSDDPMADRIQDIQSLETCMPGLLSATVDWFSKYKVPDGKPLNSWAFDGQAKDADYAHSVIAATHKAWGRLIHSESETGFALANTTVRSSPHYLPADTAGQKLKALTGAPLGQALVDSTQAPAKWHYVHKGMVTNSSA
ncbi:Inorganic pyrophosphatase [Coemansia sp. RSA 2050]|nr:Inorganic pyrophosphatase [Coemansia sp. RSA 2050]KAJ2732229.1 inorganic diphosphatase activity protein [Coemansia sp. BCRC 34962]